MIDAYLKYHEFSWAPATLRAAGYTLGRYMNPPPQYAEQLWKDLEHLAPYARNTAWIRCAHYYEWLIENRTVHGENQFKAFAKKHKRLFRGAYRPEKLTVTFQEAEKLVASLPDGDIRRTALRMLYGAQRWSDTACGDGLVVGKGNKVRQDYSPETLRGPSAAYSRVYKALKALGLKPHTLRKLALNKMVDKGATVADLMEVAGWSSMSTAASYLQPKEHKRLKEMLV